MRRKSWSREEAIRPRYRPTSTCKSFSTIRTLVAGVTFAVRTSPLSLTKEISVHSVAPLFFSRDFFSTTRGCPPRPGTPPAGHSEPRASQRAEKIRHRRIFAERQAERRQPPSQRRFRVVIDAGYFSAGQIENRERLQYVIQLRAGEVDMHVLAAAHASQMFEIAHAILVEHDAPHGQFRRCGVRAFARFTGSLRIFRLCCRGRFFLRRDGIAKIGRASCRE